MYDAESFLKSKIFQKIVYIVEMFNVYVSLIVYNVYYYIAYIVK